MYRQYFALIFSMLLFWNSLGYADESLTSALGLHMNQAKQVQDIQNKYRPQFSAKRQAFLREERHGRQARINHDSAKLAQHESAAAQLLTELKQIRQNEHAEIRRVLTPEQQTKFEQVLQQRKDMHGSSRDDKLF